MSLVGLKNAFNVLKQFFLVGFYDQVGARFHGIALVKLIPDFLIVHGNISSNE